MVELYRSMAEMGCLGDIAQLDNVSVEAPARISGACQNSEVGAYTYLQPGTSAFNSVIGRFCSIAAGVAIGPGEHPTDWLSTHPFTCDPGDNVVGVGHVFPAYRRLLGAPVSKHNGQKRTIVGSDVWIGQNAVIMQGRTIGHGAIIAAGSVVTRDVEPYSIVGGVPAKHIKFRLPADAIAELLAIGWWDYDLSAVTASIDYANVDSAIATIEQAIADGRLQPARHPRFFIQGGAGIVQPGFDEP